LQPQNSVYLAISPTDNHRRKVRVLTRANPVRGRGPIDRWLYGIGRPTAQHFGCGPTVVGNGSRLARKIPGRNGRGRCEQRCDWE